MSEYAHENDRRKAVRISIENTTATVDETARQRDELLEAIENWKESVDNDPGNAHWADDELDSVFRRVQGEVWANGN